LRPSKIHVSDFKGGWNPSVDAFNAPGDCLLRADNLTWDQTNVPRLRPGSEAITSALGASVDGSYTTLLDGTRKRLSGSGGRVYNGSTYLDTINGTTGYDTAFGSHMDQILYSKHGGLKKKWDGTTVRNWGIAAPTVAPTVASSGGNTKVISTCNNGTWSAIEGTQSNVTGYDGGQAQKVAPDATSDRGVLSTAFAAVNLNDYGSEAGCDEDLVEAYILVENSELLTSLSLQFDCNSSSSAAFQDDYYQAILNLETAVKVKLTGAEAVQPQSVQDYDRERIIAELRDRGFRDRTGWYSPDGTTTRLGRAESWVRVSIPRGKFERVGSTASKNWETICGVRIIVQYSGAGGGGVSIDNVTISGGINHALTGKYLLKYVYIYDSGTYQAKSGFSPTSDEIDVRAGGINVTVPASPDSQVTAVWVYILGGGLNRFYRGGVIAANGGSVVVGSSEVTLAILNITLENNSPPPDNIIGIVGPHASRTWVLTPTQICPSRRNNPDSFDATQAITVGDDTEIPYWVVLTTEGALFVGTSKSVYSITGYGLEYPDGTTDFAKRSIAIEPPIDYGVATDGFTIFYVASDGWRAYSGGVSQRIVGTLDLLYRGENRFGVYAVNLGSSHARFRCAFYGSKLYALSGESVSGNESYSPALHVFDVKTGIRERRVYPFNITSLYREPDGGVLAGCTDGIVREIELGTVDGSTLIPVEFLTPEYHGGTPLHYKDPFDMEVHADTGSQTLTTALYVDSAVAPDLSPVFATSNEQVMARRIDTLTPFRIIQARGTISCARFTLREIIWNFRLRPQSRLYVDTGYIDTGKNFSVWVRRVRIKARIKAPLTVIAYFDDVAFGPYTVTTSFNKVTQLQVPLPKNYKGRQPRIVIYTTDNDPVPPAAPRGMRIDEFSRFPSGVDLDQAERMRFATVGFGIGGAIDPEADNSFECYWVDVDYLPTGNENEARTQRVPIG